MLSLTEQDLELKRFQRESALSREDAARISLVEDKYQRTSDTFRERAVLSDHRYISTRSYRVKFSL